MNSPSIEKNGRVAILLLIVFAILLEKAACQRCEHFLKSEKGYFGRRDFRGYQQNATRCTWKIQTAPGSRIKLILSLFDDKNCTENYLAVYDGLSTKNKLLGKFCGRYTAPVIIATTNRMLVISHSDMSQQNRDIQEFDTSDKFKDWMEIRGFQAFYTSECNHVINATDGNITSPDYPNSYPNEQLCVWEFQTTPGKRIKLFFDHFDLEFHKFCWFDFVAIYDGATTNDTLLGKYCGDRKPNSLISNSHRMLLVFHAGASETRTGFSAHYSTEYEHSLKSKQGYFAREVFKRQHQNDIESIWRIETESGSRIKLLLRIYENCTVNYLAVYDGHSTMDKLLGKFCGRYTAQVIIATANRMLVVSHSDTSQQNGDIEEFDTADKLRGWEIRGYRAFYATECNHIINATEGKITSPNYPSSYPNELLCIWELHATPGKRIKLVFDHFNLEFHELCWFDFVALYDGATTNDTLLGKYCGDRKPNTLISTSHIMLMVFHADVSGTCTGFRAYYSAEPASNNSHMEISSSLSDVDANNEDYTKQTSPGI